MERVRGVFSQVPSPNKGPEKILLTLDNFIQDVCWTLRRERLKTCFSAMLLLHIAFCEIE